MKLIYAPSAKADLNQIFDYISKDNPRAAEETVLRLEQTLFLVCQFPEMGHLGELPETRELSVPGLTYRIIYKVEVEAIRVLNIIHTARQWP